MKHNNLYKVYRELHILLKLYLIIPLSSATAVRSFSALRKVKTYLRNRLTNEHVTHYLILQSHKNFREDIDLQTVMNSYIIHKL